MNDRPWYDVVDDNILQHPNWNQKRWEDYKVTALYKTFSGEEFVESSLASIYRYCHKIVMINSDVSWSGEEGNTVRPVVENWASINDVDSKIIHINGRWVSQDDQYYVGWRYIKEKIPETNLVLLIDTDEVWNGPILHRAISQVFIDDKNHAWTCWLKTYIRSIFYKIDPPEWCRPVIFISTQRQDPIEGPRGTGIKPKVYLSDIYYHHFSYVRSKEEEVMKKIKTSFIGDGLNTVCVPMDDWIENKWNKLPFATNFHTTKSCEKSWKGIERVYMPDMPEDVFYNEKLTLNYTPYTLMEPSDQMLILKYAEGANLAVELGTFFGRGAVVLSIKANKVVTIDLYEDIESVNSFYKNYPELFPDYRYQKVKDSNWMYTNIDFIKGNTVTEASKFEDHTVDIIFIDGDHTYEGIKGDYHAWFPKIKHNGIIMFHDYGYEEFRQWPGVKQFVDSISEDELEFLEHVSTMKVFRKI